MRDYYKSEPKIIQTYQRVMDPKEGKPGDFLIQSVVTNIGNRTANNMNAKIIEGSNPIEDLSYMPIDSPMGKISPSWPKQTDFKLYPKVQLTLRCYLPANLEGHTVHVSLMKNNQEVHRSPDIVLTRQAVN